jgi:hypothetical protein
MLNKKRNSGFHGGYYEESFTISDIHTVYFWMPELKRQPDGGEKKHD